jgi:hypothetical protein
VTNVPCRLTPRAIRSRVTGPRHCSARLPAWISATLSSVPRGRARAARAGPAPAPTNAHNTRASGWQASDRGFVRPARWPRWSRSRTCVSTRRSRALSSSASTLGSLHNPRQPYGEGRPPAGLARYRNVTAHDAAEPSADGKAKSGAAVFARCGGGRLENSLPDSPFLPLAQIRHHGRRR